MNRKSGLGTVWNIKQGLGRPALGLMKDSMDL